MGKHFAFLGIAALVLLSGCVQDVGFIRVDEVCALPDDCAFSGGGCDQTILSRPVIDVAQAITLQLYIDVTSQLAEGGDGDGGVDTHTAYIDRISTSYSILDPGFSLGGSGATTLKTIGPGQTETVKMYVIDEDAGAELAALAIPVWNATTQNYVDMVAHVTVHGHLEDQSTFKTEPYDLALRVCRGCLPVCAGGAVCPPGASGQTPIVCEAPTPSPICVSAIPGNYCGGTNVANGDPNTLYVCNGENEAPANASPCPTSCDASATPNVCI
ncbi:MAG TPA: hypothetical protein VEB43_07655 [Anaeromyxobacter sp.]|nr:hypothetical protein [Anaeromyxobacter sp.]